MRIRGVIERNQVAAFFALACGISWILWDERGAGPVAPTAACFSDRSDDDRLRIPHWCDGVSSAR